MALDALNTIDLTRVALVSVEERMVRDTTITMPRSLHKKLKKIADSRDSSMNIAVNTALAHWLSKKGHYGSVDSVRNLPTHEAFQVSARRAIGSRHWIFGDDGEA